MAIGHHKMEYEVLEGWQQLPEGWSFVEVAGVAVDNRVRVYVFNRGEHPVIVFDKEGRFLDAWGEDIFTNAHGIYIDENDHLFCADHFDHIVRKLTTEGELLKIRDRVNRPDDLFLDEQENLYIAELGWAFMPTRTVTPFKPMTVPPVGHDPVARVTVCDLDGNIQARFGGSNPILLGNFIALHGIWADSRGDLYVGEVIKTAGAIDWTARPVAWPRAYARAASASNGRGSHVLTATEGDPGGGRVLDRDRCHGGRHGSAAAPEAAPCLTALLRLLPGRVVTMRRRRDRLIVCAERSPR